MKRVLMAAVAVVAISVASTGCKPQKFANCDAVHTKYKGGIARPGYHQVGMDTQYTPKVDKALYDANSGLDRDKDGVACEA